ncbi:MAG TPA: right-handed parallel beta-helix repeat-containing protein, partial [Ignavibacteria bacterium]|nr:right-handed parallel beta-helix repeat-containing protein [Ignavibacteria bacterium]
MKYLLLLLLALSVTSSLTAQTNSVELKDGGGTVLSQHSSIQEAYNTIPGSISQAYTIEILTIYTGANETFPITFTNRSGSSSSNTITLRPAAGNTGEMIVGSSNLGTLILSDADYVIIDGRPGGTGSASDLIIENTVTSGTNANTLQFIGGANNNIVRYTHFKNATQGGAGPRTIEFADGAPNSNNVVEFCKVEGGRSGIGFDGDAGIENVNTIIRNCEVFNFGYAGIWLLANSRKILIEDCEIYQTTGVNNTLNTGINIGASVGDTITIRRNKIRDIQSTSTATGNTARGIWFQSNAPAGSVWNIYNNFIALPLNNNSAQNIHGIDINGTNPHIVNCYYNSIRIGGNHTAGTSGNVVSSGIRNNSAAVILTLKNNICINNRTGGTGGVVHTGFAMLNTSGVLDVNYNTYFANGTNSFNAYWNGTGYTDLGLYKTAASPNEQN